MVDLTSSSARIYARLGQAGSALGVGLVEVAAEYDDVVVFTADMAKPAGLAKFMTTHPNRFFNTGIAEQNLVGLAAGVSNEGYSVVASAQACFLSMRCFEQVRQFSGYMGLPITYVGVAAGFGLTYFGNTHYALEDVALFRSIPGMIVVSPSDPSQAIKATQAAIKCQSPVYIRCTGVPGLRPIYNDEYEFKLGKAIIVREGSDLVVVSSGAVLVNVVAACDSIAEQTGLDIKVVDMHTVAPIDKSIIASCLGAKAIVTVEEHFITGGLGSAVAEFLAETECAPKPALYRLGVDNKFSIPGDYQYLIETNGLDVAGLVTSISDICNSHFGILN